MSGPVTILAVDDDPEVLWATERMLAGAGFRVLTNSRAADVLDQVRQRRPALVLLDVVLADGSGIDVARRIKEDPELADVFVILASGVRTSPEDAVAGLAGGLADGYVTRPYSRPELLARVDAFLRIRAAQVKLRASEAALRAALEKVKLLSGLIPICAGCKKIRDDKGYWSQIEVYLREHSEAEFSHGLCPECVKVYFPGSSAPA